MPRTNANAVVNVLGDDYDAEAARDVSPFIAAASSIVDKAVLMATSKALPIAMEDSDWELVERWLAAHCYCCSDKPYSSRSTEGASGSFQAGQTEKGFQSTEYGRMAVMLDYSGCLENLGKKQRASGSWLGKPRSQQIPYNQRS